MSSSGKRGPYNATTKQTKLALNVLEENFFEEVDKEELDKTIQQI